MVMGDTKVWKNGVEGYLSTIGLMVRTGMGQSVSLWQKGAHHTLTVLWGVAMTQLGRKANDGRRLQSLLARAWFLLGALESQTGPTLLWMAHQSRKTSTTSRPHSTDKIQMPYRIFIIYFIPSCNSKRVIRSVVVCFVDFTLVATVWVVRAG